MTTLPSLANPAQQDLPLAGVSFFSDESVVELATQAMESRGDHTAAHLFLKNPQVYKAICFMYASGAAGQLKIASVLRVSVHTVRAVIQREKLVRGAAMDTAKTLESMSDLRAMTLETLIEKLSDPKERAKIPFDKLMIGVGIVTEKIELLRGNATERIEHVDNTPATDEFQRWLRDGSIDLTPAETGSIGESDFPKGDRGVTGLLAAGVDALPDPGAAPGGQEIDQADHPAGVDNRDNVGITVGNPNNNAIPGDVGYTAGYSQGPAGAVPGASSDTRTGQPDPDDAGGRAQAHAHGSTEGGRGSNDSADEGRADQ